MDGDRESVFGAAGSRLWWWKGLDAQRAPERVEAGAEVTALGLLLGERSLLVGDTQGTVAVWFPVRVEGSRFRLTRVRGFEGKAPVLGIVSSPRDKSFLVLEKGGRARLSHATSERTVWTGRPLEDATAVAFAPKADGAALAGLSGIVPLDVTNPHSDVSLKSLFGRIWYEGYDKPEYVWQSTGGTDDFETKFSLAPLLFGTVKGTLYSLLLAIPLAVFGAMYTSQFMHPKLRSWVKPVVELMAALPSVVLGFLAGLWLAPRMEDGFPAVALCVIVVPVAILASGFGWSALPGSTRRRFPVGAEVAIFAIAIVLGIWASLALAPWFESAIFGGSSSSGSSASSRDSDSRAAEMASQRQWDREAAQRAAADRAAQDRRDAAAYDRLTRPNSLGW